MFVIIYDMIINLYAAICIRGAFFASICIFVVYSFRTLYGSQLHHIEPSNFPNWRYSNFVRRMTRHIYTPVATILEQCCFNYIGIRSHIIIGLQGWFSSGAILFQDCLYWGSSEPDERYRPWNVDKKDKVSTKVFKNILY